VQWAVTPDFRLEANVTYLDSKYVRYPNASPSNLQIYCRSNYVLPYCNVFPSPVPQFRDLSGTRTRFAPKWSASFNARYGMDVGSGLRLTAEVTP
jgi:outer membrane receptor protein involved in Fe transport